MYRSRHLCDGLALLTSSADCRNPTPKSIRIRARLQQAAEKRGDRVELASSQRLSSLFLSFRAGCSPRGICFSYFSRACSSRAARSLQDAGLYLLPSPITRQPATTEPVTTSLYLPATLLSHACVTCVLLLAHTTSLHCPDEKEEGVLSLNHEAAGHYLYPQTTVSVAMIWHDVDENSPLAARPAL